MTSMTARVSSKRHGQRCGSPSNPFSFHDLIIHPQPIPLHRDVFLALVALAALQDVRLGELVLLALRRLGLIRTQGRDVDQTGNTGVHAGVCDDGSPVGVADKYDRTADLPECADGRVDVVASTGSN